MMPGRSMPAARDDVTAVDAEVIPLQSPRASKRRGPAPRGTTNGEISAADKLPDLTPAIVCQLVAYFLRMRADRQADLLPLLKRLTSDPRMRKVWTELQRRKRTDYAPTNEYLHPVSEAGPHLSWTHRTQSLRRRAAELRECGGTGLEEAARLEISARLIQLTETTLLVPWSGEPSPQDLALACFFNQVVELAKSSPKAVPVGKARSARRRYITMAKQLRIDAGEHADQRLLHAAHASEELADLAAPPASSPLLVPRSQRGDATLKGFVITLADITNQIFNAPLYGTIATVTNVAFDRDDMTDKKVRKMLRASRPPSKAPPGHLVRGGLRN
jgi:hypothetical protein